MRVALYTLPGSGRRAIYLAEMMALGLKVHGIASTTYRKFDGVRADIAMGYGWSHRTVFNAYRDAGAQYAYFDLGYWNRRPAGMPMDGHYRLAMNDWDTVTHMPRGMPGDRFKALDVEVKPRRAGKHIVIASMSIKAVKVHGYAFHQWETMIADRLQEMGYASILRDKPNKKMPAMPPIGEVLANTSLLVTHHSNAAVDAIAAGVPVYALRGVGSLVSPGDLTKKAIETPYFPSDAEREAFLADVAYAQWQPAELRSGAAWEFMRGTLCA